jgi:hypothetical protein
VGYRLLARLEVGEAGPGTLPPGHGRPRPALPAREAPGRTVEQGFRFLKNPLFFTGSAFLKRPERVMALTFLVYALEEWALRRGLAETGSSLPDGKGKPTQRPTLRWVFGLFIWVRLVELEGRPLVLNLPPITRPRCACWGRGDITSWSEGVRNVGMRRRTKVLQAKDDGSDISLIPAFSNQ